MFKLIFALSTLCAIASAGYISGYGLGGGLGGLGGIGGGLGGHAVSYSIPAYQSASYVSSVPVVKTYSAPIVKTYSAPILSAGPVVKTVTPLSAHSVRAYKVVETAPTYVHSAPVVYADHGYSGHYGIHYGKKR